jgi:quercetin dioxygenase-like cupin family protein
MQVVELATQHHFAPAKFQKVNIFDSPRMFCDIYCFEPGQSQAPHAHEGADKIYYVLEGRGTFTVGAEERELGSGLAVLCPPGEDHGVVNTSGQRLVVLVFMAPHP